MRQFEAIFAISCNFKQFQKKLGKSNRKFVTNDSKKSKKLKKIEENWLKLMKIDENWVKLDEIDENCAKVKILSRLSCRGNLGTFK